MKITYGPELNLFFFSFTDAFTKPGRILALEDYLINAPGRRARNPAWWGEGSGMRLGRGGWMGACRPVLRVWSRTQMVGGPLRVFDQKSDMIHSVLHGLSS